MKKIIYHLILLLPSTALAQSLRIEDLWENKEKNLVYQQRLLQTEIKKQELRELQSNRFPVFYIDANLQRNLIIPTTPVPAIAFNPSAEEGAIIPLKFATKWSSKAGLQLEWDIFDPKRKIELDQKSLEIQKTEIDQLQQLQDWKKDASLAYAAVVLASNQLSLAQQDSANYKEILEIVKARYDEGRARSVDYLQAEQEFERKRIQLHESWAVLLDADLELRSFSDLSTVDNLSSDMNSIISLAKNQHTTNYTLANLAIDNKLTQAQIAGLKKQLLPSLKINGYLGQQYYSNEFRLDRSEEWYGNSFINLALRVPLSAYITAQPTIKKLNFQHRLNEIQRQEEELEDYKQTQQKILKVRKAEQKLESYQKIATLAEQSRSDQELAYREGRLLLSELNQSISAVNQAHKDVWQAQYDLLKTLLED